MLYYVVDVYAKGEFYESGINSINNYDNPACNGAWVPVTLFRRAKNREIYCRSMVILSGCFFYFKYPAALIIPSFLDLF